MSDDDELTQFPPPQKFVELLLDNQPTVQAIPRIRVYSTRPIFDRQFNFCGAGWYPDDGFLIHGPEVEVDLSELPCGQATGINRLPLHLQGLLQDFCFRGTADLANAVAAMLTGLLMPHFLVVDGKPLIILDGNQPGVGKTLFGRVMGVVLDNFDPRLITYTLDDEELGKRIAPRCEAADNQSWFSTTPRPKPAGKSAAR